MIVAVHATGFSAAACTPLPGSVIFHRTIGHEMWYETRYAKLQENHLCDIVRGNGMTGNRQVAKTLRWLVPAVLVTAVSVLYSGCCADNEIPPGPQVSVTITSPSTGDFFVRGNAVAFEGIAEDPDGNDITGNALVWGSSLDGEIGKGESISVAGLSLGRHDITLTATDSEGRVGIDSIHITVRKPYPDRVTERIWMWSGALSLAASPDGKYIYATSYDHKAFCIVQTSDNKFIYTIPVGRAPYGIAVAPDGRFAYVANMDDDTLSIIDLASNEVTDTIPVGFGPFDVAVSSDGKYVFVSNADGNTVSVINALTKTVTATIPVGAWPHGIALKPGGGNYLYVANSWDNSISVVDLSTNTVVDTISLPWCPFYIAPTPDGNRLYISNQNNNMVSVVETTGNTVVANIPVGAEPYCLAMTSDGAYVYVTSQGTDTVSVIRTADNTVVDVIPVGRDPYGIAITPDNSRVYVADSHEITFTLDIIGFPVY